MSDRDSLPRHPASGLTLRPPPSAPALAKATEMSLRGFLAFLAVAVLCGAAVFVADRSGLSSLLPLPGPKSWWLLVLAALPLLWIVAVGVHEFGHLVGGWLIGGRFLLWVVGPFKVQRTPAGLHFGWNTNVNTAGGMAACLPHDPRQMTPHRMSVMILGGPAASLVFAGAALLLNAWLLALPEPVTLPRALTQHLVMLTAGLSALVFLVTIFPMQTGGFKSDGRRALDLLRGDARSRQEQAVLALTLASMAGQRPADFDNTIVADALSLGDGSLFDLYAHLLVYSRAADRGEWTQAQRHLDAVLAGEALVVPYVRDIVRCEYAWLFATAGAPAELARQWLESAGKLAFDPATRLRAEAAVLLAEGKFTEAKETATRALEALEKRSLSPVKNPFAQDALERIITAAETSSTQPSVIGETRRSKANEGS